MKLEYLDDITGGGKYPWTDPDKLIRLYDFDDLELMKFRHLIKRSLIDRDGEIIVSNLDFVQPLNCTLTFRVSELDAGVKFPPENNYDFVGLFSKNTYINMLDIIDRIANGYNWLYDPPDDNQIDLLLSSGIGSW